MFLDALRKSAPSGDRRGFDVGATSMANEYDEPGAAGGTGRSIFLILLIVVAITAVFIAQNRDRTKIEFLFFDCQQPRLDGDRVAIALGVLLDRLILLWWRRARSARPRLTTLTDSAGDADAAMMSPCGSLVRSRQRRRPRVRRRRPSAAVSPRDRVPRLRVPPDRRRAERSLHVVRARLPGARSTARPTTGRSTGTRMATTRWPRRGDRPDGGLVGFGHSMGGAGLMMAAHRDPGLFDVIVAFEPIVFPDRNPPSDGPSTMVEGARAPARPSSRSRPRSSTTARSRR